MNSYTLALFLHVCGVIGFFLSLGTWIFGLVAIRRAQRVEQVRAIAALIALSDPLAVMSILLLIAAGLYMALTVWGLQTEWIDVALGSLILLAPVGPLFVEPRLHAIAKMAEEIASGAIPTALAARTHDPLLGTALHILLTGLLGIIFLMTNKPTLTPSILIMVIAVTIGLASGIPLWWRAHIQTLQVRGQSLRR
jgi:hypothetical protein